MIAYGNRQFYSWLFLEALFSTVSRVYFSLYWQKICCQSHVMDSAADNSADGGQDKPNEEEKSKRVVVKRPQIIHKSSKELYKAVAAQWGITCKMSDHCRCLDCQVLLQPQYLHSYTINLVNDLILNLMVGNRTWDCHRPNLIWDNICSTNFF